MTVRPLRDRRYVVETDGGTYVVDVERRTCTCPDHAIRGARCKHLRRVAIEITERRIPAPHERPAVCAVCGDETFVALDATGPRLCDRHTFEPGTIVTDRETGSALAVVRSTARRADAVETREGRLVADYETNRHYGRHEPVVEAVYLDDRPPRRRYHFPASRLRRVPGEPRLPLSDRPRRSSAESGDVDGTVPDENETTMDRVGVDDTPDRTAGGTNDCEAAGFESTA
jgi:hypothetical protein